MKALELGALEKIMLHEDLDFNRYTFKNPATGEEKIVHLNPA
jgi:peptide subunit release factor 1 (eRF1)